jgi:hypothetical protein
MENTEAVENTEVIEPQSNTSDLNILNKDEEPKAKKEDYFKLRITGKLPDNAEDQIRYTKGEDLKLETKEELWKDESIKKSYQDRFGNKAFDNFFEDYNKVQNNYNEFQFKIGGKSTREAILNNEKLTDEITVGGITKSGFSPEFSLINKTDTGALDLFDIHTEATRSVDKTALDLEGFYDPASGEFKKLPKPNFLEGVGAALLSLTGANFVNRTADLVEFASFGAIDIHDKLGSLQNLKNFNPKDNPLYTDEDGNQIKALEYISGEKLKKEELKLDPTGQYGSDARGTPYMQAVYYGQEVGGKEIVSNLDLFNITEPQLKSGVIRSVASALPRAIMATQSGIIGGAASTMLALNDLTVSANNGLFNKEADYDNAFRRYFESIDAGVKSYKMGVSEESKSSMTTTENLTTGVANVAIQLFAGYGLASMAGKAGSVIGLTSMAVEGARDQAIAAGFNKDEAAIFQLASIGGMAASNYLFSWVDKKTVAAELAKQIVPELKLAYQEIAKDAAKEVTQEGRKKVIYDGAKKIFISTKNIAKSIGSKLPEGAVPEALEESTELIFEKTIQQLTNVAFKDEGQEGFMSLNDPKFMKQFYQELGMSAGMGALGGVMGNQAIKLFNKGRNTEDKINVATLILTGRIGEYYQLLDKLRNTKNGLGSDNLSTEFDNQSNSFKVMSEGAISHNEANYRLLLNEVNALQQVIKGIGAKKAMDMIQTDPNFKDVKLAGTAINDVQQLTKRYLDIVSKAPTLQEAALDPNMKFESIEKEDEYFRGLSVTYNVTEEEIRDLVKIKKDLNNINSGLKTEEYVFSNLMKMENPGKFDDNFTGNLFAALKKRQKEKEEEAKDLKDIAEKSEIAAEGLKDDLSNVDEITNYKIATKKAKKLIGDKFKNFKLEEEKLNKFKDGIFQQYLAKDENGNYLNTAVDAEIRATAENLAKSDLKGSVTPEGLTDMSDVVKYKAAFEKNLKLLYEIHDNYYTQQLENLNGTTSRSAIENISNFSPISFLGKPVVDVLGNLTFDIKNLSFLLNNNSNNVNEIVKELISNDESKNFPPGMYSKLQIQNADVLNEISSAKDKIGKLNQFMKVSKDESFIAGITNNFDYIWDEVVGEGSKVAMGNSFYNKLHGPTSIHEIVKSKNADGVNLFDDITTTENLLEQVRIKQSLIRGLRKYHSSFTDYRSHFSRLMDVLDVKGSRKVDDILAVFNSTYLLPEAMKNFSDVMFDYRKLQLLRNKYKPTIEEYKAKYSELNNKADKLQEELNDAVNSGDDEKAEFLQNQLNETFDELKTLNSSHQNEIGELLYLENVKKVADKYLQDLNKNERQLKRYLETAKGNQTVENKLKNRMNGTANKIKSNTKEAHGFLNFISTHVDPVVNGLIDVEDPTVKEFLDYFKNKFEENNKSAENLKEDNNQLYKFYDYLRNSPKRNDINTALFVYFDVNFNYKDNNSEINRLIIASQFDIREFNVRFDAITKDSPNLAYSEQEEVALTAAAHVNTNISELYFNFRKQKDILDKKRNNLDSSKSDITIEANDVMTLFGNAGSGKSTFGLGLGINIGLDIKGKDNTVFLASNTDPQIQTLKKTSKDFNFDAKVAGTGVFEELINYLESARDGKIDEKELDKLNLIIFDEATVQSANAQDKDSQSSTKYGINKLLHLVTELNKTRSYNNRIKIILSGDPKQNGYTTINEDAGKLIVKEENIGADKSVFFGTEYLDINIRGKVQAIADIALIIKNGRYHDEEIVGNNAASNRFKSVYGLHEATNTKLGVQFATEDEDMFNDDELINNIKKNIESNPDFKIGIVGNDIDIKNKLVTTSGDSKLDKLIAANPSNFEFYTHENVQGQTFDYTIATMDQPTFFNNNSVWLTKNNGESYVAKKLATTIERSSYYTLVVNKTERRFQSNVDNNLSLTSSKLENAVVTDVKEFLFKTRPDTSITVAPAVAATPAVVAPAPIVTAPVTAPIPAPVSVVPVPSVVVATTKAEIEKEILRLESELATLSKPATDEIKKIEDIKIGQIFSQKTNPSITAKITGIDTSNKLISLSTDKVDGESEFNEFIEDWQLGIKTKEEIETINKIQDLTNKLNEIIENEEKELIVKLEIENNIIELSLILETLPYDNIMKLFRLSNIPIASIGTFKEVPQAVASVYYNEVNPELKKAVDIELDIINKATILTEPADEALKVLAILTTEPDPSADQEKVLEENTGLKTELMNTEGDAEKIETVMNKALDGPILEIEEVSIIPTEQEKNNADIINELEAADKEAAIKVQQALYNDAGLISASFVSEMLEGTDESFTKTVIQSFVNQEFNDFDYTFQVSEHEEKGIKFNKVFIKIADKKSDRFTSIKIFTSPENSKDFNVSQNGKVISTADIKQIINNVTSGKVNSEDKANVPLKEFKESLRSQGFTVSDNVYVFTEGDSIGDSFILVSPADVDLDSKMAIDSQEANTVVFDTTKSLGKKIRRFKNSTAVIKLNLTPLKSFSALYYNYEAIMKSSDLSFPGTKYLNNFTGDKKNSANIIEFLSLFLEQYSGHDYSIITNNLKGTDKTKNLIERISKLDKDKYTQIAEMLHGLMQTSIGAEKLTRDNLFLYSVNEEGKKIALVNFELLLKKVMLKMTDPSFDIKLLDEVFEAGFPNGFYARFKAFKNKTINQNTLFAVLDKTEAQNLGDGITIDIEDSYTVNVNKEKSLGTPLVYINSQTLLNVINNKKVIVTTTVKSKVTNDQIKDMISNLDVDSATNPKSQKYKEISSYINNMRSSKNKKELETLFSDKVKELNKSPLDLVYVDVPKKYIAPEFSIVFDNEGRETGEINFDTDTYNLNIEEDLQKFQNELFKELKELTEKNVQNENINEVEKLMLGVNQIALGIDDEALKSEINKVNTLLEAAKNMSEIFPTFNPTKNKFITKELSVDLKNKLVNLGFNGPFQEDISKLESRKGQLTKEEFKALENYLSSLKDCN